MTIQKGQILVLQIQEAVNPAEVSVHLKVRAHQILVLLQNPIQINQGSLVQNLTVTKSQDMVLKTILLINPAETLGLDMEQEEILIQNPVQKVQEVSIQNQVMANEENPVQEEDLANEEILVLDQVMVKKEI